MAIASTLSKVLPETLWVQDIAPDNFCLEANFWSQELRMPGQTADAMSSLLQRFEEVAANITGRPGQQDKRLLHLAHRCLSSYALCQRAPFDPANLLIYLEAARDSPHSDS